MRWYAGRPGAHRAAGQIELTGEERPLDEAVRITIFRIVQAQTM
jgi:hypothetical protein